MSGWLVLSVLSLINGILLLVSYITSNTFPQPLTPEEEAYYLERLEKGDREARNILAERNLRLVAHIVKKFEGTGEDNDDLISIGTIGLIKAINTYSRDKGTKLATYAARCIENEILMHLRATKNRRQEVFLDDPIGQDKEGNEITLNDILGTDPDEISLMVEREFDNKQLLQKVKGLSKRELAVLDMRFGLFGGEERTQKYIARLLGISRSYVSRIEKRAINKLLKEYQQERKLKH
ncbi:MULTISPECIES: RNA polymerase sporulation sigma factor SigK [Carboxydocella]|uniref:RNA polymerase, sigma 27/28 subunit, RpsK/SigK n=2 Tax=Carboxydocella TaxID=178898 RepID=A0A1T4RAX0_9FIRM|nr:MULTISPECIES: RNA polymerase sporulation sigma factor SigK [Carboxydocella]AVX19416.1 RNA polymerase, sigma 27/28 subunit, RpsK/SigK [Carboxydocella thermautotrophica]AVX29834.1 RNA polymerase, sigma 27/28 subunit, RpsK/SigK [Carboxydocella thermautotrophica]SKA13085.1 RNA polymerase, sigma 27/28 subunit, RpsK/SigK [Carboxydocella sporoproducens DSM 16521]GAW29101.1 sporulation sigma factor SigK [Carboxydocella sp. ULO1]GAW31034.1 sporulation sigma factor SigK [Carboxydocella sp. JDF658]